MSRALVEAFYAALARGDRDAVAGALHPDFEARFDPGLPHGLGGVRRGAAAIEDGWWAIGARYAIRAEPEDWLPAARGQLVVLGTYRGRVRATGAPVRADFVHVWTVDGERLRALCQYTDTSAWVT